MKTLLAAAILIGSVGAAAAQGYGYGTGSNPSGHYVSPYTTQNGTYVQPHYSSNPNNTQYDNYGTRGNTNPYTGAAGTRNPRW